MKGEPAAPVRSSVSKRSTTATAAAERRCVKVLFPNTSLAYPCFWCRKVRNRLSQQAFRTRQSIELNELRSQLQKFSVSESTRNKQLVEENDCLKQRLWNCEKKLKALQVTLGSTIESLSDERNGNLTDVPIEVATPAAEFGSPESNSPGLPTINSTTENAHQKNDLEDEVRIREVTSESCLLTVLPRGNTTESTAALPFMNEPGEVETNGQNYDFMAALGATPLLDMPTLNTFTGSLLEEQFSSLINNPITNMSFMTPSMMQNDMQQASNPTSTPPRHNFPSMSTSKYSDHIEAYEACCVTQFSRSKQNLDFVTYVLQNTSMTLRITVSHSDADYTSALRIISFFFSAFVKLAWARMEPWHDYTNSQFAMARLSAWRLFPSPTTFAAIPKFLRPTELQTAVPHPAVIDWCIFPFLRDKLVRLHCSDPCLDDICGDIGKAYVVETDLSELIVNGDSLKVYFNVLDIVLGLDADPVLPSTNHQMGHPGLNKQKGKGKKQQRVTLPAPNLMALLHSQEYKWALYYHLKIGEGGHNYRLDPSLFSKHPQLYEPNEAIACGVSLRSTNELHWPAPLPLDSVTFHQYQAYAHNTAWEPRLA